MWTVVAYDDDGIMHDSHYLKSTSEYNNMLESSSTFIAFGGCACQSCSPLVTEKATWSKIVSL